MAQLLLFKMITFLEMRNQKGSLVTCSLNDTLWARRPIHGYPQEPFREYLPKNSCATTICEMRVVCLYHQSAVFCQAWLYTYPGSMWDVHPEDICWIFSWLQSYRPFPLNSPASPPDVRKWFQEIKPATPFHCSSVWAGKDPSCAVSQAATSSLANPRSMGPKP